MPRLPQKLSCLCWNQEQGSLIVIVKAKKTCEISSLIMIRIIRIYVLVIFTPELEDDEPENGQVELMLADEAVIAIIESHGRTETERKYCECRAKSSGT